LALAVFGVDESRAAAAGIVTHAAIFGAFIVGGAYYLLRGDAARFGGTRLGELVARARSTDHGEHDVAGASSKIRPSRGAGEHLTDAGEHRGSAAVHDVR